MSNTTNSISQQDIEIIDLTGTPHNHWNSFYGIKDIKTTNYHNVFCKKIPSDIVLNELDIPILEQEFQSYNIEELNEKYSKIIAPKIMVIESPNSYTCVNSLHSSYIISKIKEPLDISSVLKNDIIENDDKLFFMDNVSFPRRKLSMLASSNGKLKNISRVTKIHNATKIIANKLKIESAVNKISNKKPADLGQYMLIKTKVLTDPNLKNTDYDFKKNTDHEFTIRFNKNNIYNIFDRFNFKYADKEHLEKHHPELLNVLRTALNDQQKLRSNYYSVKEPSIKRAKGFNLTDLFIDVESVEIFDAKIYASTDDVLIDESYIYCINKGYKLTDVSAVFDVIGNEKMDYEKFIDTNTTLIEALKSNNSNITSMMLESLTSYDINSSIFYLALLFRNSTAVGLQKNQMNTSVQALYNLCYDKARLGSNTKAINTPEIIAQLSKQGYKMEIPLSFILGESMISNTIDKFNSSLGQDSNLSQAFDIKAEYTINIKENIIPHIIIDLDIQDFNKSINNKE